MSRRKQLSTTDRLPSDDLRVVRSIPGDLRDVVGQPIVENSGVVFDFPAVRERDVFALLVYPIIDRSEAEAAFRF